jgi:hypothetical protein
MLKGQALKWNEDGSIVSSLTSREVYAFWKIPPYGIALLIRRLRWFAKIVAEPDNNQHFLACFFGVVRWERERGRLGQAVPARTLGEDGGIRDDAHPWALLLRDDLDILLSRPECADFEADWRPRSIIALIKDESLRFRFTQLDPGILASSFVANEWTLVGVFSVLCRHCLRVPKIGSPRSANLCVVFW